MTDSSQLPSVDNGHPVKDLATGSGSVPETEKWATEKAFRERELALKETELKLKREDQASSGWRSPLVVAILAATLAAAGNAVIAIVNGNLQRDLEDRKAEQTRILEMIKTDNNPDKAAVNLDFLLKSGLISDPSRAAKLKTFLEARHPGTGPALPSETSTSKVVGSIAPLVKVGAPVGTRFQYNYTRGDGSLSCVSEYVKVSATGWYERPSSNDPTGCLADAASFTYTERESDDPKYILLYDEDRSLLARLSNTERGQSGPTAWRLLSDRTWNAGRSVTRVN